MTGEWCLQGQDRRVGGVDRREEEYHPAEREHKVSIAQYLLEELKDGFGDHFTKIKSS